ncbi:ABC transporter substrate-binding protein [Paucibacter sp. PLA-PC-4]|uniref:ABC transporter substrate-binding protein n=1 Tax=Paucibacter sp. PLA-PC-4 TaxID=2993655 RepID=UPI00224AFA7E|nr:ABC transporter substrate-binding protein [Paucibacter sp. PLA-PC-4]MCX2863622.1 ABC transporter substrate-binding protein [Paucibacter sp. PLA-PC-4]
MPTKTLFHRTALLACLLAVALPTWAQQVYFINPGHRDETFWRQAGEAMQAAADSLGISFSQDFADRDPNRVLALGRAVAARPANQRPDYVLLVNEKATLVANARVLSAAGIKSFAAFSGLLPQEQARFAPRRAPLQHLLGSLQPKAEDAGYLTAKALIARGLRDAPRGADGRLHLLALAGDRSTTISIARNDGLLKALAEHRSEVVMDAMLATDWKRELARQHSERHLQKHRETALIWCGTDLIAFGALDAARAAGRRPGQDLFVSGINTSAEAMQAVVDGELSALAGGHFMAGAFALAVLYDHHRGRDFAAEGLALEHSMFIGFDAERARRYLARFGSTTPALDMRPFSKVLSPQLTHYRFAVQALLLP